MESLLELLILGQFLFLFLPSVMLVLGAWWIGRRAGEQPARRRLLLLLGSACLALAALDLLIWTNPYGREISSSLPAFGMLPPLVALLILVLLQSREYVRLWQAGGGRAGDRAWLAGLLVVILLLAGLLWWVEPIILYIIVVLSAGVALIWTIGTRSRLATLSILSLACVTLLILITEGSFFVAGPGDPEWLRIAQNLATALAMVLAIFLAATLLYASLRPEGGLERRRLAWHLFLVALLVCGSAYMAFWDGIWSAAHARAFEDHLPFVHFLLSLIAGVLLAISLRGWRRLVGSAFVILATTVATLALTWGWNISAFELTERRARRVDQAVNDFHQANARYPTSLAELTPRYLPYLPPPVVVRQGGWCYQAGPEAYRLGYVSGAFTYFEADFWTEMYAQAGEPPQEGWACDELIRMFEAKELNY